MRAAFEPLAGSWGACGPEEGLGRCYERLYVGITVSQQIRLLRAKFNVHLQFRPLPVDGRLRFSHLCLPGEDLLQLMHTGWWQSQGNSQRPSQTRPAWSCPEHSTASSPNAAKRLPGELPESFHNEERPGTSASLSVISFECCQTYLMSLP